MHMLENLTYESADGAWRGLVGQVLSQGDDVAGVADILSVGSGFGKLSRASREVLGSRTGIDNPRDRLVFSQTRRFRLDYAIAQVVWAFSRSDAVAPVTFYNPTGLNFSDDGKTVRSAIGPRVFGGAGGDQFHAAIEKIRADASSRRAMIQVYLPSDLLEATRDVSCTGSIHLLARDGILHAVVHMRSQSALMVLPYDLFLLTMIHELAAVTSGLKLGTYCHLSNSAHVYEDELVGATALLDETPPERQSMPPMPVSSPEEIARLIAAEAHLRKSLESGSHTVKGLEKFRLSTYWRDLLLAIAADWSMRSGRSWEEAGAARLPACYQKCLRLAHREALHPA